jgi:pilus assembly protein Flp/PilA
MSSLIKFVKDFAQDEEGLTILEYVIGAALIVIALVVADPWNSLMGKLSTTLEQVPVAE